MTSPWNGFLVVDKPRGLSSREALNRVQTTLPRKTRIGHTGTLDPLATGVLVLAIGQATRLADAVQAQAKEYLAGIRLGATSATDDAEGPITEIPEAVFPSPERLDLALATFVGVVEQTPPAFSAAHVDGRRAYRLARQGLDVELKSKPVRIDQIERIRYEPPAIDLVVECGKGTYIRSIARDLGRVLGCGAYLTSLRRTRVGAFSIDDALSIDASEAEFAARIRPLADAVPKLPAIRLPADDIARLGMGQLVATSETIPGEIAVFDEAGVLCVIADIVEQRLRPTKVFK